MLPPQSTVGDTLALALPLKEEIYGLSHLSHVMGGRGVSLRLSFTVDSRWTSNNQVFIPCHSKPGMFVLEDVPTSVISGSQPEGL